MIGGLLEYAGDGVQDALRTFRDVDACAGNDLSCQAQLSVDQSLTPQLDVAPCYTGPEANPEELRALEDLTTDSLVERRPTVIADLRPRRDGGIRLAFEGKRVAFPARARAEVERLADADEPVRLSDLPGELDDEGRLVLARRLVREGFLRFVE